MDGLRTLSLLVLMGQPMWAEDVYINVQTTTPTDARYQIVQSTITTRDTYRLDTHSGRISRLIRAGNARDFGSVDDVVQSVVQEFLAHLDLADTLIWEEMIVWERPTVQNPSKPRFQIFLSGITTRDSYLIDTRTGETWQVVKSKVDPDGPDTDANTHTVWVPLASFDIEADPAKAGDNRITGQLGR